jgi:alpha-1,3-fucosyltransferase
MRPCRRALKILAGALCISFVFTLFLLKVHRKSLKFIINIENELDIEMSKVTNTMDAMTTLGRPKSQLDVKVILLQNYFFGAADWNIGFGEDVFQRLGCKHRCYITDDHNLFNKSAAVLFHILQLNTKKIPQRTDYTQRWVLYVMESPIWLTMQDVKQWNGLFNWTMLYKLDSDIPLPFGHINRATTNTTKHQLSRKKEKLVAWMVSHCRSMNLRHEYVDELKKYVDVDVYGKCGTLNCSYEVKSEDADCMRMLAEKYKFYLAFENSFCKDYVTEKFFKTLAYDIVPIVRGGADYKKFTPAGTKWYINTADFTGPKELAEYLLYLDANPEEYEKYLQGREAYKFEAYFSAHSMHAWCDLCDKLHNDSMPAKVYDHLDQWWTWDDCWRPKNI